MEFPSYKEKESGETKGVYKIDLGPHGGWGRHAYRILPNFDVYDSVSLTTYIGILYETVILLNKEKLKHAIDDKFLTDDVVLRAAAMVFEDVGIDVKTFLKDLIQNVVKINKIIKTKINEEKDGIIDEHAV